MLASIDYYRQAVELRERAADAWLAGTRRRLLRQAADLESAGTAAERVERLRRAAKWDAEQATKPARTGVA